MPIYEYACGSCEHELEELQKFSESPLVKCPECGEDELARKMSASAFHLKGGGWYKDGYSNSSGDSKNSNGSTDKKNNKPASSKKETASSTTSSTPKSTAA